MLKFVNEYYRITSMPFFFFLNSASKMNLTLNTSTSYSLQFNDLFKTITCVYEHACNYSYNAKRQKQNNKNTTLNFCI